MALKVTWKGRPVTNRFVLAIAPYVAGVVVTLVIMLMVVVFGLLLLTWPIWFLLHYLLIYCGRRGFVTKTETGIKINVGPDGFRRADVQTDS